MAMIKLLHATFYRISTIARRRGVIYFCENGVREELGSNNIVKMAAFQSVCLGRKLENCSQIDFSQEQI